MMLITCGHAIYWDAAFINVLSFTWIGYVILMHKDIALSLPYAVLYCK